MKRVLTTLVLFPLITWVVLWSPQWTVLAVTAVVALLCFYEYSGIAEAYVSGPRTSMIGPLGFGAGLLILVLPGDGAVLLTVVAVALIALSLALRADDLRAGIVHAAFLLLGVVYVFGCWRFAPLLAVQSRYWLLYALVLNWIEISARTTWAAPWAATNWRPLSAPASPGRVRLHRSPRL